MAECRVTIRDEMRPPTYHRQRLLLFLLEQAGGVLSRLDLQKLLFLYVTETGAGHFAFVPYRFGCYSFLATDDLALLHKRGWLDLQEKEVGLRATLARLAWAEKNFERRKIRDWLADNPERGDDLVRKVYRRYPYYAIRSEMKERLLDPGELAAVRAAVPGGAASTKVLFTIGYEGRHFEDYVNRLLGHDVKLLCDVRRNPLSRKLGFSQGSLAPLLPRLGIEYCHLPELGIEADSRKQLNNASDYETLFAQYRRTLANREAALSRLLELLENHGRIAITCFEREPDRCHRHCVSDFLAEKYGVVVSHL